MTLTLELDPEEQARIESQASQAGLTPEEYIRSAVGILKAKPRVSDEDLAALLALRGSCPNMRSVDEFIRAKREETEREDTKYARLRAGL